MVDWFRDPVSDRPPSGRHESGCVVIAVVVVAGACWKISTMLLFVVVISEMNE